MRKPFAFFFMLTMAVNALAQERTITGKVTSAENGTPIPGVNVVLKGTSTGTATDAVGVYALSVPSSTSVLVFSFVGMVTTEVEVGERSIVDVVMEVNVKQLSEVVITALGLEMDRDKVGSASTRIDGKQVVKSGEPTLINGLSGKSSGLIISRSSGDPGSGSYIQIRGQSSITGSVQPLIVVDGVPVYNTTIPNNLVTQQSRLNDINPSDIESVEVLKGASASALWGTRAGNGVIMITTKKGSSKGNKMNISYSGTYSVDQILIKHPLQRTYGQGNKGYYYTNVLGAGAGNQFSFGDKIANRPGGNDILITDKGYFVTSDGKTVYPIKESDFLTSPNGGKNSKDTYDPYDAIFGDGHSYDQTLSLSGGNKDGNYYMSLGDLNQQGTIKKNSNYRRTSFRINTERQMNDWMRLSSNLNYSRVTSDRARQGQTNQGIMLAALRTSPDWNNALGYEGINYQPDPSLPGSYIPFTNHQLAYRSQIGRLVDPGIDNPVWSMNNDKSSSEVDRFLGNMHIDIDPIKWLTITLRGGVDYYSDRQIYTASVGKAGNPTGSLTLVTIKEVQYNIDGFARGRFKLSKDLRLTGLVGFNANSRTNDFVAGTINTFVITTNPPLSLDNALAANDDPSNGYGQQRSAASYATVDLEYKDQLFLGLTGRAENSSVFSHEKNPTFFYPSATVSWHLLKTLGLESNTISFTKIRVGYGIVSTIPGPYNTATYWGPSLYTDGFNSILQASGPLYGGGYEQGGTVGNRDIRPETKTELEFGFDLRILHDRVSLGATYFTNEVKDVIIPVSLAGSTGFTGKTGNAGVIKNNGIELELSSDVVRAGNFKWNVYGNWTRIRNMVTNLGGTGVVGAAVEGYPLGVFYGTTFERTEAGVLVLDNNGFPKLSATSTVVGDPNAEWRSGLGSAIGWKNFSFNVLFEHSQGGNMLGITRDQLINYGTHGDTDREVTLTVAEAATIRNYTTTVASYDYPRNTDGSYTVRGYLHDFGAGTVLIDETWWKGLGSNFSGGPLEGLVEPAQWTKLREVSMTYMLTNPEFRKKSRLSSIVFSITGRNLFLWTEFKGNDPESNTQGPVNARGRENYTNPATKSFLFSIKINY